MGLIFYFRLFNTVDSKQMFKNFADDSIRTADIWYWKQPIYQLSHNHCPTYSYKWDFWSTSVSEFFSLIFNCLNLLK